MNRFSALICLCSLFLGCSSSQPNQFLRSELANKGPVALSADNPYIASNLFVAREMEASQTVKGFIKYRGTPNAIEVKRGFLEPIRVYLFYLDDNEGYVLEDRDGEWLVRGPEVIPHHILASVSAVVDPNSSTPLVVDSSSLREPTRSALAPPTTEMKESIFGQSPADEPFQALAPSSPARKSFPGRNSISSSSNGAASTVSTAASGDILHRVSFPGETLRLIAEWYTGTSENMKRIARINSIEDPDVLYLEQTIRVPRYLLKTTKPLPAAAVERYVTRQAK